MAAGEHEHSPSHFPSPGHRHSHSGLCGHTVAICRVWRNTSDPGRGPGAPAAAPASPRRGCPSDSAKGSPRDGVPDSTVPTAPGALTQAGGAAEPGCRAQGRVSWAEATGRFRLSEQDLGAVSLPLVPAGRVWACPRETALSETTPGKCTSQRGGHSPNTRWAGVRGWARGRDTHSQWPRSGSLRPDTADGGLGGSFTSRSAAPQSGAA